MRPGIKTGLLNLAYCSSAQNLKMFGSFGELVMRVFLVLFSQCLSGMYFQDYHSDRVITSKL